MPTLPRAQIIAREGRPFHLRVRSPARSPDEIASLRTRDRVLEVLKERASTRMTPRNVPQALSAPTARLEAYRRTFERDRLIESMRPEGRKRGQMVRLLPSTEDLN